MFRERLQGGWQQVTGRLKEQWGRLTNDNFAVVAGRLDQLSGRRQLRLDVAQDDAIKHLARRIADAGARPH
jgi:uncharacterized protein YjbJ (UPF0337 family)